MNRVGAGGLPEVQVIPNPFVACSSQARGTSSNSMIRKRLRPCQEQPLRAWRRVFGLLLDFLEDIGRAPFRPSAILVRGADDGVIPAE